MKLKSKLKKPLDIDDIINSNRRKSYNLIKDALSQNFPDKEPLIDDLLETLNVDLFIKLGKNFKEDLEKDKKLESFLEFWRDDAQKFAKWQSTLFNTRKELFNARLVDYDKEKNLLNISWVVLVESYVRDFEILIRYIIEPILEDILKNSGDLQELTYSQKIDLFFNDDPPALLGSLHENTLKPYFRSLLAHQQYYYDSNLDSFMFFRDGNSLSNEKTEKIDKAIELCFNICVLVNIFCISILDEIFDKNHELYSRIIKIYPFDQFIQKITKNPLYEKISKSNAFQNAMKILPTKWDRILTDKKEIAKFIAVINESGLILDLFLNKKIPPQDYLFNVVFRVSFLIQYELIIQQFVKPLYYSYNVIPENMYPTQEEMIEFSKSFDKGKYSKVFSHLHSDLRNSIAHFNYSRYNERYTYYDQSGAEISQGKFGDTLSSIQIFYPFERSFLRELG